MGIVERVVLRHMTAARWDNSVNGSYFSLRWNKTKWSLEEMLDGSRIPATSNFGEGHAGLVTYEMPQLGALLSKYDTPINAHSDSIRVGAKLQGEDTGPVARQKLITASNEHMKLAIDSLREDGSPDLNKVIHLAKEFEKKLVWKKIKA
jgi:hypothetical protein